jgi:hypothetical protein
MKIEILYFEGCPNHEVAEKRVRDVLNDLGIEAELVHINVKDETTAEEVRFPGSPTIRVNGEDVAPGSNGEPYSMRCRVYPTTSGFDGAPDEGAIRTAIEKSAA